MDRLKASHPKLEVHNTYGYRTKHARIANGIAKSHCADAFCIAGNFGANDDTLRALAVLGFRFDSSFNAAYLAARLNGAAPVAAAEAGHVLAGRVIRHRGAIMPRAVNA